MAHSKRISEVVILPESVRYALRHRKGIFGRDEVRALAHPRYKGLATYLTLKGLDGLDSAQLELLHGLAEHIKSGNSYEGMERILEKFLPYITEEGVQGQKAAQVSRMGFDLMDDGFRKIARQTYSDHELPVLLAYAALLGYEPFINEMPDGVILTIMHPKKAISKDRENFGYKILKGKDSLAVELLNHESELGDTPAALIDDTRKSGDTLSCARNFFAGLPGFPEVAGEKYVVFAPLG